MADNKSREVIEYIRQRDLRYNLHTVTDQTIADVIELYEEFNGLEQKDSKSVGKFTLDMDCSEALKGLKAVQREARNATQSLAEFERKADQVLNKEITISMNGTDVGKAVENNVSELHQSTSKDKLLVIELDNEESAPKVFHEGKEITEKVSVSFDWRTKTDRPGKLLFNVEYYELDDKGFPNLTDVEIDRLTGGDQS
ncbi:hypothetical protein [Alkalibacillus almallahensis]|uniref:hypothetical protein n=1 Tax=Alkalibacillus almallahensis TaxID=1379154 RepID=UPI001420C6CA|nr:hypothetical protein [Alkalibacillus almallahensis]NIK10912.1 hypothetical protein [Alkalibacillus almallahensis]